MNQETIKKLEKLLIDNQECYKLTLIEAIKQKKAGVEAIIEKSPDLGAPYMMGIARGYANILELLKKFDTAKL
jgi:hypothetical protein